MPHVIAQYLLPIQETQFLPLQLQEVIYPSTVNSLSQQHFSCSAM